MTSETLIQQASRENEKRYQQEQGKLGSFQGKVVSVTPISDEVGLSFGPANERRMPVQHPFSGLNSWLRSMPEVGTLFLMQNRFDSAQAEAIKTIPVFPLDKSSDYQKGLNVYRALAPGEHDFASTGYAFQFMSRRGNVDLRSGASVKLQLNRETQEVTARAPTHRKSLLNQTVGEMGDESRLGIIKRWDSAAEETFVQKDGKFLSESYLSLLNPSGAGPVELLRYTEGHVYDDKAQAIKHTTTAIALRSQKLWFTTTDETLKREIDENGNHYLEFPSTATTGYEMSVPQGSYRQTIGVNRDVTINKDEKVVVKENVNYTVGQNVNYDITKNLTMQANGNEMSLVDKTATIQNSKGYGLVATDSSVTLTGPKATLEVAASGATTLEAKQMITLKVDQMFTMEGLMLNQNFQFMNLGKGAAIPAVLGITLQAYLDQHVHTVTAPGLPTTPPNVPSAQFNGTPLSITSVKILMMGNI